MKKMLVAAAALASAFGLAGQALAADINLPPPVAPAPPPPAPPAFSWAGPYGGIVAGYGWGNFANGIVAPIAGAVAGAFVGVNLQNNSLVYSLEADFMWSNRGGTGPNAVNWTTSIRGRLGFAMGHALFYGTGGVAIAGVTTTTPSASTEIGWTVGAGLDVGNDVVFGRIEYLYANYGTVGGAGTTTLSTHEARAGVGIRF